MHTPGLHTRNAHVCYMDRPCALHRYDLFRQILVCYQYMHFLNWLSKLNGPFLSTGTQKALKNLVQQQGSFSKGLFKKKR